MNSKHKTSKRQSGFFDMGLSLIILAITGTVALSVNHVDDKRKAAQQERAAIEKNQAAPSVKTASAVPSNPVEEIQ